MTTTPHLELVPTRAGRAGTTYEIEVAGLLGDHWAGSLDVDTLVRNDRATAPPSTALTVTVVDQAQLHGVIARIRDLGIHLLSLARVSGHPGTAQDTHSSTTPTLERTLRTARLTLRPATADDADPTWAYRRLPQVNEWLTGAPDSIEAYRTTFVEPSRLATTVIVERTTADSAVEAPARLIGDFMLRREEAWAQAEVTDEARGAQAELGWSSTRRTP